MTNQQGAPEALFYADALDRCAEVDFDHIFVPAAAVIRRLHAENERLAALVEAQQPAAPVQNPAGIEHVAGDVSKNGAESNMAQQPAPSAAANEQRAGIPGNFITHRAAWRKALERCKITAANSEASSYWEHEIAAFDRSFDRLWVLMQPSPTPQADSQPAGEANWAQLRSALAMLMLGWGRNPNQTVDACYQVLDSATEPGTALAILRTTPDWRSFMAADRAKADSVLEDAARWFSERDNVLHSFWVLLGEAEAQADNDNNPLLKHQVEGFYRQWNALNGTTLAPRWVTRAARKQGANHD